MTLVTIVAVPACATAGGEQAAIVEVRPPTTVTSITTTTSTTVVVTTTVPSTTTVQAPEDMVEPDSGPPTRSSASRIVTEQDWTPFAEAGGVTLLHPASRVERVGFHEANHDGARQLEPLSTAVAPVMLETRGRPTDSRTAADVVVDPGSEIRAPVTGTVTGAGTYVLYCDYSDDYLIIEPDQHPGWEVKVLHINGVAVAPGDRVAAGQTVIAPGPTPLPFVSDVDKLRTTDPAWPHVHLEIIDPSIPDIPSPSDNC